MMALVVRRDGLILDVDWHPTGGFLAIAGSDRFLQVWKVVKEVPEFVLLWENQSRRSIRRCKWSPDGNYLLTAEFDAVAMVYAFDPSVRPYMKMHRKLKGQDCELKTGRWSDNGE
jgi:WD40 repeat protein